MSETLPLLDRASIQQLPPFKNLNHQNIVVIENIEQCKTIEEELKAAIFLGFDSESKPTFRVGEVSTGPHLIQLATEHKAYLFHVNSSTLKFLQPILSNPKQLKVGFGLKNDKHIFHKKGIELESCVDLAKSFSHFGFTQQMGVQKAVALLFGQYLSKSKKVGTSNWAQKPLNSQQISYAAADAYAALLVFLELRKQNLLPTHISQTIQTALHV
ncbi:3'-5' exonuclease domain-containing protein 2 [Acinetobacter seifertii]|uniref:3'-5' exonuclease domain-containing protein 2 n=2 Tax=Acinetobacter TaxID=469 RepID=A0A7H2TLB0_9GAMM|nr:MULTISPECIES: 3'-5' exonuclease [Acinetobacter]MBD1230958.1 3'-5' exonuclease domain-containing protein 2 [Acinetobacter seifertii]ONN55447.1 exonuclease [Acinetobacter genomosp. 33YU]QNX12524.1 3'-5' exonuclease domain-containing protein 2 [Acinetobacter seifertii]QNX19551.1 3'-5' exonuclease domain-containing protein 2 [Acinetobacter seifertii]QNX26158.1 3'-5' exonuclease domain-containing protein 2 [Acinetobacter seifertii]